MNSPIAIGGADTVRSTLSIFFSSHLHFLTLKTVSAVQSFFLAMAMYPAVQKKAQAEIDAVVGSSRLPDFGDRSSLPYINALLKESMRWQSVAPLRKPIYG